MVRRIAFAIAAVGVLIAALWFVTRKEDREARAERAQARLPAFDARAVTALTVETRSGPYRVVRGASGWRIVAPLEDAASATAVEALLGAVRTTPVSRTLDAPEALSSYGLDPPVARVRLEGVSVPPVEIGDVAPAGDGVFARVPGRGGVLILRLPDAQPLVDLDVGRLRDTSIVDLGRSEVTSVEIGRSGVRVTRTGDVWWIEAPRRFPAATTQVDKLLGAVYGAKVVGSDDTGSPSDRRFGLGEAGLRLTLRTAAGTSREVVLGGDAGGGRRYLASEGRRTVLLVEGPEPSTLPVTLDALRDTRLTAVNRYAVARFAYAASGRRYAASKKDDTWVSESGATLRSEEVYALLVRLLEAPTAAWSDGAPAGAPSATLEYATTSGETGRVEAFGDRATWSALPGVAFRLNAPLPAVP